MKEESIESFKEYHFEFLDITIKFSGNKDGLIKLDSIAKIITEFKFKMTLTRSNTNPAKWLESVDGQEEIESLMYLYDMPREKVIKTVRGGKYSGTYVIPELCVEYVNWIDKRLGKVFRKYMLTAAETRKYVKSSRELSKIVHKKLTAALKQHYAAQGRESPGMYAREMDMIQKAVLGGMKWIDVVGEELFKQFPNYQDAALEILENEWLKITTELKEFDSQLIATKMNFADRKKLVQVSGENLRKNYFGLTHA